MKIQLTHKGWLGICPVYTSGDVDGKQLIVERHWSVVPLFLLSESVLDVINFVACALDNTREAYVPVTITGQLPDPIEIELDLDDSDA